MDTTPRRVVVRLPAPAAPQPTAPAPEPALTAAAPFCSPCEASAQQAATRRVQEGYFAQPVAEPAAADDAPQAPTDPAPNIVRWEGVLGFEGQTTGDGRRIELGALRWDGMLPVGLRYAPVDTGVPHGGAMVVGLIETLTRSQSDGAIYGTGYIDLDSPSGPEAARQISSGQLAGVSLDLDDMDYSIMVRAEALEQMAEMMAGSDSPAPADADGYVTMAQGAMDDEVMVVTDALVRTATLVQVPAFANARISLTAAATAHLESFLAISDALFEEAREQGRITAEAVRPEDGVILYNLTAAGGQFTALAPPVEFFANPNFREPTALTVTDDGRVYGHAALWGTCHIGFPGQCVTPPVSRTNYSVFRTGVVRTPDGDIPVGPITLDTGHATPQLSATGAAAHYDHTGTAVADVTVGEDAHGIWFAGALRPNVSSETVRTLAASPLSGDWRAVNGNLELVALLAVNTPGFPVPRARALVSSGATQTLIYTETPEPLDDEEVLTAAAAAPVEAPAPALPALHRFASSAADIKYRQYAEAVGEDY